MTALNDYQRELLFDYSLGLTTEEQSAEAQALVFSNEQAATFVTSVRAALSPLDSIGGEPCPDELAEGTIWRAQQAVRTGNLQLTQLIEAEGRKSRRALGLWRTMFGQFARAAVFMIVGLVFIMGGKSASNLAHQKYWQTKCGSQLAGMYQGLANYKNDNAGQMPAFASSPGAPWWKVGDQGTENVSNTRRMWVLVKNDYVKQDAFVCPARKTDKNSMDLDAKALNDFPNRNYVLYSFRIGCPKSAEGEVGKRVLVADRNPIFDLHFPASLSEQMRITLDKALANQNSINHRGKGQNVLFCDGEVKFVKVRYADVTLDDIFTLQDKTTYEGTERPANETDAFLAP